MERFPLVNPPDVQTYRQSPQGDLLLMESMTLLTSNFRDIQKVLRHIGAKVNSIIPNSAPIQIRFSLDKFKIAAKWIYFHFFKRGNNALLVFSWEPLQIPNGLMRQSIISTHAELLLMSKTSLAQFHAVLWQLPSHRGAKAVLYSSKNAKVVRTFYAAQLSNRRFSLFFSEWLRCSYGIYYYDS